MIDGREIRTKHGSMTVEQLAEVQPGMARLMDEYGRRYWALYYAGKSGNWPLAQYMLSEMRKLGRIVPVVRPKYAEAMSEFETRHLEPLASAVAAKDATAFEDAYHKAKNASDEYHARFAKPFIRFRLPRDPPSWLQFEPEDHGGDG